MSAIGALAAAGRAVLDRPRWWVLALAGFLVRGGILTLLVPMIQAPSSAGLANWVGPTLVGFVFGGVSVSFLVLVVGLSLGTAAWLLAGGVIGAAVDLELTGEAAEAAEVAVPWGSGTFDQAGPWAGAGVRLLAHLPTAAVVIWGAPTIVAATYEELIHPGDPSLPVILRVVLRIPQVLGLLAAAWAVGEAVGGLALRHLAAGDGIATSLWHGLGSLVRPSGLLVLVAVDAVTLAVLAAGWLAVAAAYDQVRIVVRDGDGRLAVAAGLALLSMASIASLTAASAATAWRSAAWTFELARRSEGRTKEPLPA